MQWTKQKIKRLPLTILQIIWQLMRGKQAEPVDLGTVNKSLGYPKPPPPRRLDGVREVMLCDDLQAELDAEIARQAELDAARDADLVEKRRLHAKFKANADATKRAIERHSAKQVSGRRTLVAAGRVT